VNAGIYVLEPEVLTFIPPEPPVDFGRDVFPGMLAARQRLYGYRMDADERLWWIDTPADLARVERAFHDMTR
jgi:NDP-sugar pyrophosphorylase family protein